MTPYEILGLKDGSSIEAATERYNILMRKLREADSSGGPLEKATNLRLQQLRAAFEEIAYDIPMPLNLSDPFAEIGQLTVAPQSPFEHIEKLIEQNRYEEAIQQLPNIPTEKNAYWRYLYGISLWGKGAAYEAVTYLQQAAAMEPNNIEFTNAYNELQSNINKSIQDEKNRKTAEIATGTALVGTGICASCMCEACCNS